MTKTAQNKQGSKAKPEIDSETVAVRALARSRGRWPKVGFSERRAIERLAALQAVKLERKFNKIFGSGAHVWSSEAEFNRLVQEIYDRRVAERNARKIGKTSA